MNYRDLYYNKICPQKLRSLPPYDGKPDGFVLYKNCFRASVSTLGLTNDHQPRSPTIHVFDSIIVFSRAFFSEKFPSTTLFCGWVESNPSEIIFWERQISNGITADIDKKRFIINEMSVKATQKPLLDSKDRLAIFQSLIPDNGSIAPIESCSETRSIRPISASLDLQPLKGCFGPFNAEDKAITLINSKENEFDVAVNLIDSKKELSKEEHNSYHETNNNLFRMEAIKHFLSSETLNSATFFLIDDDSEVDSSGTIYALRNIFDVVCPLGDALILARRNPWHNMNKTILNEFKSQWEEAIMQVKEKEMDGFLSDSTWLQAMWLHVIGFPMSVRSKRDVIAALFLAFSKLTSFSEVDIISALTFQGFRQSLSQWICDHCCFNSLKEDVLRITTYMPWNSYLCSSVDGCVHYTHLHEDSDGSGYSPVAPAKVVLTVGNTTRESIESVELEMGLENWTPEDFVKSVFKKLQDMMEGKPNTHYVLGHCCPEQAIVSMAKSGISPFATCRNKFSCGRGMYFFKLDHATLQFSFEVLHDMAHGESMNPSGLQFRAFLYAMLTVFQKPECDALSISVLVFITCYDFEPLDSTVELLPLCNDNDAPYGWKCNCKSSILSISPDLVKSDTSRPLTTSAICTAISTINRKDVEKVNAFALLGGIVDFDRILSGVYTSVIMDNNLDIVSNALENIPNWSDASKYKVWRDIVKQNSSYFRRPTAYFNHMGGFSLSKPDRQLKNKPEHWSDCPLDPIQEIVFVNSAALSKLLVEADQVSVIFLRPDAAFSQRTDVAVCFRTETPVETSFEDDVCLFASANDTDKDFHMYWKKRNRCRILNCCKDHEGISSPSELENSLPKKKSSQEQCHNTTQESSKQCHTTQEQLYKYYPGLKPHDRCPCCQFKVGFHENQCSKRLSGAPHSEGTGLDGDGN